MDNVGLLDLQVLPGKYKYSIDEYCNLYYNFCKNNSTLDEKTLGLIHRVGKSSGIKYKYTSVDLSSFVDISLAQRNKIAKDACWDLLLEISTKMDLDGITHVVSSSSTLFGAPAIDADVVSLLHLSPTIQRLSLHSMGCTGGGAALSLAMDLAKNSKEAKVLVVCADICTPYMFKKLPDVNDIISGVLFGDGIGLAIVGHGQSLLKLHQTYCYTPPNTLDAMNIAMVEDGLRAQLSRNIDTQIGGAIWNLQSQFALSPDRYLVHPGGKSILVAVQEKIGVTPDDIRFSWNVFHEYGNMAAPTILFVLRNYIDSGIKGETIDCYCFGQGLYMIGIRMSS